MRSPAATVASGKKMKFEGEPKKPPSYVHFSQPSGLYSWFWNGLDLGILTPYWHSMFRNGYQKFSQEMLSNGELNHLPMKERMAEIGSRWQSLPLKEKDRYKKIAEEKQRQYKVQLEQWLAVRHIWVFLWFWAASFGNWSSSDNFILMFIHRACPHKRETLTKNIIHK